MRDGSVKRITPDFQLAKSLAKIAEARMRNIEALKITDDNSFMIIENCYEAIRELIDALLAVRGFKSYSHEAGIDFLREHYSVKINFGNINRANRYRILRNDIKYRGLITTKNEAEDVLKSAKDIIGILREIFDGEMSKK